MQHSVKTKMRMNASKTQTVRLRKPAGVCRTLFAVSFRFFGVTTLFAARQIGWFFEAGAEMPITTLQRLFV